MDRASCVKGLSVLDSAALALPHLDEACAQMPRKIQMFFASQPDSRLTWLLASCCAAYFT
jgi:hypothetical protein